MSKQKYIDQVRELMAKHDISTHELQEEQKQEEEKPVLVGFLTRPVGEKNYPIVEIGSPIYAFRGIEYVEIQGPNGTVVQKKYYPNTLDQVASPIPEQDLQKLQVQYQKFLAMEPAERAKIVSNGYNKYAYDSSTTD